MVEEFNILDQSILFCNIEESLGMGGPFTGKLEINHIPINGVFVVNEPISYQKLLFLVKMNEKGKWRRKINFSLFIYDIEKKNEYESFKNFKFLSILSVMNQINIEIIKSFSSTGDKEIMAFNEKNFKKTE